MSIPQRLHAFTNDALGTDDATEVAARIRRGEISAADVMDAALARANAVADDLGAIVAPDFDRARTRAQSSSSQAVFAGVPTIIKDNTDLAGLPTNHGSPAIDAPPARFDAAVTRQYLSTGAIPIGKSAMPEFGFNATTEYRDREPVRNPWSLAHSAGGSSGGSAALVAAGVLPIAHANDGGGSIRIPAAACGLVGLKPTRGRDIPDAIGSKAPINLVCNALVSRSVRDTANYFAHIERFRPATHLQPIGRVNGPNERRLRIAVVTGSLPDMGVDEPTRAAVAATAGLLESLGHEVIETGLPLPEKELNQFRDDFLHYWSMLGFSTQTSGKHIFSPTFNRTRTESLTRGLCGDFMRHLWRTPAALTRLKRAESRQRAIYDSNDVVLSPVVAHTTPMLGHLSPATDYTQLLPRLLAYVAFTPLNNANGTPAISLPLAHTSDKRPIGIQLAADHGDEKTLLELAFELEAAQPFARITD